MERTLPPLPHRAPDANKVRAGKVVILGGSLGMAGAPALAALGAHRAGAGLVRVLVPERILPTVAGFRPETMCRPLPDDGRGILGPSARDDIREACAGWDVLVVGPGLGRDEGTVTLLRTLIPEMDLPLVLDADGLFAWSGTLADLAGRTAGTVLTPHEGEAARLLACPVDEVRADRMAAAERLASACRGVAVLKGPGTIVRDGTRRYTNPTGGPALATGGTGDVLSGVIAALVACSPEDLHGAACLGVYLHGRAADHVAAGRDRGLLASELAEGLPDAIRQLQRENTP